MNHTCCIIVPCFNEVHRLKTSEFILTLKENSCISIVFVDDGSKDNTIEVLQKIQAEEPNQVNILSLDENKGKAEAVRRGMLFANEMKQKADYIGYLDADLSTPFTEILNFLNYLKVHPKIKIIMGSRFKRLGSNIDRTFKRHFFGRIFATFTSIILNLPVYDSQCGAKLLNQTIVHDLFKDPFITKWIFDVEILARYQNLVGKKVLLNSTLEMPLTIWKEESGSKIKFVEFLKVPFELLKIYNYVIKTKKNKTF